MRTMPSLSSKCRLFTIILIIPSLLIAGCGGENGSSDIKQSDVDLKETEFINQREVQFRVLENCSGTTEYKQTVSQEQSVNKSTDISLGGSLSASGLRIIEAAIDAKYENTRSEGITAGDSIELTARPGTNVRYQIVWVWVVFSGDVFIKGEPDALAYQHRRLVEVITSPEDLGCDIAVASTEPPQADSGTSTENQTELAELKEAVSQYLEYANQYEISAYSNMDASIAENVFTGQPLENVKKFIEELRGEGLYYVPEFDDSASYFKDIRAVDTSTIEVDSCEFWTGIFYQISDNAIWGTRDRELVPQTITIQKIGDGWYISNIEFYEPPSFCQSR